MCEELEKQAKSYERRLNYYQNIVNKAWPINVPSFKVKKDNVGKVLDEIDHNVFYVDYYKTKQWNTRWKVVVMTDELKKQREETNKWWDSHVIKRGELGEYLNSLKEEKK